MFDFDDIAEGADAPSGSEDPEAQEAAKGLSSTDSQARFKACQRLVELGLAKVQPFLEALEAVAKKDDDYDVQRAAKKALKDIRAGVGVKPSEAEAAQEAAAATDTPAEAAPGQNSDAGTASACSGALECQVMQGPLIKKLGTDPATGKITKLSRKVGSKIKTTGKTWTGPSGGEWAEVDPSAEKAGWLLVEGPGFNLPGPLLERVDPGDPEPMVLQVQSPVDESVFEICMRPDQRVKHAKAWIVMHIPGLKAGSIVVTREKEGRQDASFMLEDSMKMADTPFKDGGELFWIYNGELEEDLEAHKAKLAGKK
mmetsp:Transcript_22768/g.64515  ORF Transcript_22768/g.64515 Transcript_22768/m.64515 type:complete len:312 (-) Transcript_22768:187-1122(-)